MTVVAVGIAALSCTDADEGEGDECRPGEQAECECDDGGAGSQVCDEDGSGWGDCECDDDGGMDEEPFALARFCHSLTYGGDSTELHLTVGEGDSAVVLTASTWGCAPPEGEVCSEVPVGAEVPVTVSNESAGELFTDTYTLDDGEPYFFEACETDGDV